MRVYLPATFAMLTGLHETGVMSARSGWGFAATPALLEFYTSGDEASLRLLAVGDEESFPYRRVVVSVDVADEVVTLAPENGESVVALNPAQIRVEDIAAIHIDIEESEEATKAAIAAVDAADLGDEDAELTVGDAQDNFMAFYDPTELPFLIELL